MLEDILSGTMLELLISSESWGKLATLAGKLAERHHFELTADAQPAGMLRSCSRIGIPTSQQDRTAVHVMQYGYCDVCIGASAIPKYIIYRVFPTGPHWDAISEHTVS